MRRLTRHSEDIVEEEEWNSYVDRKRKVVSNLLTFADFGSLSGYLKGYLSELSDAKQIDINDLISKGEAELKNWPAPDGAEHFIKFEVFEVFSPHDEIVEDAHWIDVGDYYVAPLGNRVGIFCANDRYLDSVESLEEARLVAQEHRSTGSTPNQKRWERERKRTDRMVVVLFLFLIFVVTLSFWIT